MSFRTRRRLSGYPCVLPETGVKHPPNVIYLPTHLYVFLQGKLDFANAASKLFAAIFTDSKTPFFAVDLSHV